MHLNRSGKVDTPSVSIIRLAVLHGCCEHSTETAETNVLVPTELLVTTPHSYSVMARESNT